MEPTTDLLNESKRDCRDEPEQCPRALTAETVVQQFEAQAARSPEVIALICDGHTLTYQQLNAKANQL
ncbi:hypothetical protein, partial [Leptolyngbya sp. BC1307]|uniref:hypothetical protein n=1 Tax=Leptolyngbya sp. BC1307 TaxID=2029589 RepID=UPI0019821A70